MRRSILLALALGLACLSWGQSKDVVITGARVEIGDGRTLTSGTVVIRDGRISAIGEGLPIPAGAEVLDAKGKVLYPGFIDAYSTRGLKLPDASSAGTAPDSRNTAPPSMWQGNRKGIRGDIAAAKCLDFKDRLKDNYAQGITSAFLAPGTGTIRGVATVAAYADPGEVLLESAGLEIALRGGGFGGGGGGGDAGYPGSLLGIIALARQTLIDAQQYSATAADKKDPLYENLKPALSGAMPAAFLADTEREIGRALSLAEEFKLRPIIVSGREAFRSADLLRTRGAAVLAVIDLGSEPSREVSQAPDATPKEVLDERYAGWAERADNIRKLIADGVPVGLTSLGMTVSDYLKNARRLVSRGLGRGDALKAMTSGPAKILGVASQTGTIEVGKRADLVLASGDVFDDKTEIEIVFVGGKKNEVKGAAK